MCTSTTVDLLASVLTLEKALLYYDYLLSFSQEVRYMWKARLSGTTAIYIVNRYSILVNRAVNMLCFVAWQDYRGEYARTVRIFSIFCQNYSYLMQLRCELLFHGKKCACIASML